MYINALMQNMQCQHLSDCCKVGSILAI